jgi:hypothetical protein
MPRAWRTSIVSSLSPNPPHIDDDEEPGQD